MTEPVFDDTGRIVLVKTDLEVLVRSAVSGCADTGDCEVGPVTWHARDSSGCNWEVTIVRVGTDAAACRDVACLHVAALREMYSVPDEAAGPLDLAARAA